MKWTVEFKNSSKIATFESTVDFDFDYCEKCKKHIIVDKLLRHIVCDSDFIYLNYREYSSYSIKLRCSYNYTNIKNEGFEKSDRCQDIKVMII
jgi:hypothetical protein